MPELFWNNFRMGQRRDAALREDALLSARELTNFDIDYDGESADLVIRPGYTIWNSVELPAPAQQLYPFVDMDQNFNLLGISNSRWRAIKESGAHVTLVDEPATATRPVASFGNRVFFGTNSAAYWTDDSSIDFVNPSFRLGLAKPPNAPSASNTTSAGWVAGTEHGLNSATVPFHIDSGGGAAREKIAVRYIPPNDFGVDTIYLRLAWGNLTRTGMIRIRIFDDNAGSPGSSIGTDGDSDWVELGIYDNWVTDGYQYVPFDFPGTNDFSTGVSYWIVVEPNETYLSNYVNTSAVNRFMVAFRHDTPVPGGWAAQRYTGAGSWVADTRMLSFWLGGLNPSHFYDYKVTYVNNDYNSESRPSERSVRISPESAGNQVLLSAPATLDPQADTVYYYRRDIGTDNTVSEDNITGNYLYVGQRSWVTTFTDDVPDSQLGARLHSEDHYLYDEDDDTNQGKRDAFIPAGMVVWKGRIWAWVDGVNKFYFTKTFERNNPMGLAGESSPDYFPLDNVMDFPVPAGIINAKALSNDQLAVYFRNEQIWIVSGGDSVLNPPPIGDIAKRPTYQTVGLFAPDAVIPYSGTNIYLGREGLYRFAGIGNFKPELLSETQTGILDDIENQYFRNCKLVAYGREVWLLIDSDNDGDLDKLLILDLERDFQTRNMVDRAWRGRTYPVAMTDLAVHTTGDEFREILAADAVDGWIMKLNDGDDDDGAAIVGTAESHDIRAKHNSFIYQLLIQGFYNDEDNLPDYAGTVTSHAGDTSSFTITGGVDLTGNEDIRGQTIGLRMKRPVSVRLKVQMTSTKRDRIRGFTFSYQGE